MRLPTVPLSHHPVFSTGYTLAQCNLINNESVHGGNKFGLALENMLNMREMLVIMNSQGMEIGKKHSRIY